MCIWMYLLDTVSVLPALKIPEHLIIAGSLCDLLTYQQLNVNGDITTPISFYRGHAYFYTQLWWIVTVQAIIVLVSFLGWPHPIQHWEAQILSWCSCMGSEYYPDEYLFAWRILHHGASYLAVVDWLTIIIMHAYTPTWFYSTSCFNSWCVTSVL
jgi:hypothetical protein